MNLINSKNGKAINAIQFNTSKHKTIHQEYRQLEAFNQALVAVLFLTLFGLGVLIGKLESVQAENRELKSNFCNLEIIESD